MELLKGSLVKVDDKLGTVIDSFLDFVEIAFDGHNTSEIVATDRINLVSQDLEITLQGVAEPTTYDLSLISKYQPINTEPLEADDIAVVTIIAADNMIDRGLARWNPEDLEQLSKLPLGFPVLSDHNTNKVRETLGVVFDSGIIRFDKAPAYFTNTANNGSYNRQIVKDEGYVGFVIRAALDAESDFIEQLNLGVGWVSLGYSYKDIYCPLCKTSFYDKACPHLIPMSWAEQADPNYAPWREKKAPVEIFEVSFVAEPNLPRAGIVRNIHKSLAMG